MAIARTVNPGRASASRRSLRVVAELVDGYGLVLFIVGAYVAEQVSLGNRFITSDSWLALLSGRRIDALGLPHVDRWTVMANGRTWVDQQWLAQLALYRVEAIGGVRLVVLLGLILALSTFAMAAVQASRLGASARPLAWVVLAALVPYGRSADNLRAQSLCYPLFLALLWLLVRPRSRWSYLVFPLLVVWANLHGSVVLAAVLVAGCALLRRSENGWPRTLFLVAVPWLCLLASPYAADLPGYYRTLLANPAFGQYVAEWNPMTFSIFDAPTYAIIASILLLVGTGRSGWRREEIFILSACSIAALLAVRNAVWLSLAAIVFVAPAVSRFVAQSERPAFATRMNRILVSLAGVAVVAAVAVTATRPDDWYSASYPTRTANVAADAAGPHGRVFATEAYADWLIWERPEFAGRVAFDARLELLRAGELKRIFALEATLLPDRSVISGYRVFVVPPELVAVIRRSSSQPVRVVDRSHGVVVLAVGQRS